MNQQLQSEKDLGCFKGSGRRVFFDGIKPFDFANGPEAARTRSISDLCLKISVRPPKAVARGQRMIDAQKKRLTRFKAAGEE